MATMTTIGYTRLQRCITAVGGMRTDDSRVIRFILLPPPPRRVLLLNISVDSNLPAALAQSIGYLLPICPTSPIPIPLAHRPPR